MAKLVNSNIYLIDMEHDLNLSLKMYKSAFSDKQTIEIKKKMHIDPIFTHSDSEIAFKVCRNKQRFKLNRSPLCITKFSFSEKAKKYAKSSFFMEIFLYRGSPLSTVSHNTIPGIVPFKICT